MIETTATSLCEKLDQLRRQLIESAYAMDLRGQHQAADVAMTTSARLGELCAEHGGGAGQSRDE